MQIPKLHWAAPAILVTVCSIGFMYEYDKSLRKNFDGSLKPFTYVHFFIELGWNTLVLLYLTSVLGNLPMRLIRSLRNETISRREENAEVFLIFTHSLISLIVTVLVNLASERVHWLLYGIILTVAGYVIIAAFIGLEMVAIKIRGTEKKEETDMKPLTQADV